MSNQKQLLPDAEIKAILAEHYPPDTPPPTAEEIIKELRLEYKMRKQVYGNKVLNHKKLSNGWRDARKQLAKKLWLIEHAGKIVKERINYEAQTDLFNQQEEQPMLVSYKYHITNAVELVNTINNEEHMANIRQHLAQEDYSEQGTGSIISFSYSQAGVAQFTVKAINLEEESKTDALYKVELEFIGTAA